MGSIMEVSFWVCYEREVPKITTCILHVGPALIVQVALQSISQSSPFKDHSSFQHSGHSLCSQGSSISIADVTVDCISSTDTYWIVDITNVVQNVAVGIKV